MWRRKKVRLSARLIDESAASSTGISLWTMSLCTSNGKIGSRQLLRLTEKEIKTFLIACSCHLTNANFWTCRRLSAWIRGLLSYNPRNSTEPINRQKLDIFRDKRSQHCCAAANSFALVWLVLNFTPHARAHGRSAVEFNTWLLSQFLSSSISYDGWWVSRCSGPIGSHAVMFVAWPSR